MLPVTGLGQQTSTLTCIPTARHLALFWNVQYAERCWRSSWRSADVKKKPHCSRNRPAKMLPGGPANSSIRVSPEAADALDRIRCRVQEWLLSHSLAEYRQYGLTLTADQTLRIILATFARDYSVNLDPKQEDK